MRNHPIPPAGVALFAILLMAGPAPAGTPAPTAFPPGFDPASFTDPTRIDNPYLPMTPCTSLHYEGVEAGHRKELALAVSPGTSMVAGVPCRDVTAGASLDGVRTSTTEECYAQDGAGNVWLLGQWGIGVLCPLDPGEPCPQPPPPVATWRAGVDGAVPVLVMDAHPRVGRTYFQRDPVTGRTDAITVMSLTASLHVPYGPWVGDVLATWETSSLNVGLPGYRYYAPGVGLLKTRTAAGMMELVSLETWCQLP